MSNAIELAASLTQRQRQALDILAKAERPLRNKDFRERFAPDGRRTTGWAKALGPCTKPRDHDPASLWARGLVTVVDNFAYTITARGREVVNATGSRAIDAKVECERSFAPLSHSVDPATALRTSEERRQPMPLAERPQSEFALPRPRVCGPPGADGSQRIPFLKHFADRHDLRYEPKPPKPSNDGLPEVYVYTHDMDYRYAFARWWDDQGPLVLWVGVNPAKGDTEQRHRPTLDRCIRRSRELGAAGLIFANLFAARHNQPSGLRSTPDPIGAHNDEALAELSKIAGWTIAAWGEQDALGRARARVVRRLLVRPLCLGVTASGDPRHPLYVAGSVPLEPWPG